MYNPNTSFQVNYSKLLLATFTHHNANNFHQRVAAREEMTVAERKLAFAQRHPEFSVKQATRVAFELKRNNEVLCAAFKRAA